MNQSKELLPAHLAIIMDGNGRWAQKHGLTRTEGHREGVKRVKDIITHCRKLGIPYLTLYVFSRENWKRPKEEVQTLFDLLRTYVLQECPNLKKQDIKLNILGELSELPLVTRKAIEFVVGQTKNCRQMTLNLALSYSGQEEIIRAVKQIIKEGLSPSKIDISLFKQYLYTAGQPDPDFIIRTSGEIRISNFLIFQAAYAELYFTPILWPDFTPQELDKALEDFRHRERRFGAVPSCL
ncbi:MAG: polyprenyl diphosphate synthase [Desulfonauticus sp.]|nr:polyprenyl diphosphate synthase [Desulfonauticus sp.]